LWLTNQSEISKNFAHEQASKRLIVVSEGVCSMEAKGQTQLATGSVTWLLTQPKPQYERLLPLVYAELRGIAGRHMRSEREGHTDAHCARA
jgi:hypothetical protein